MLMLIGYIFLVLVAAFIGFFTLYKKFRFQQDDNQTTSSSLSLSLPSPPTTSSQTLKHHDVFPSFHGADVRKNVLSHILESFKRKGIDSFIDNNIERSKPIGPELKEAIKAAKISIVLLSKNYASSSWCLDELTEIMNCREELGQLVMPIFYEVDPTDIKKQTGDFGNAFNKSCKGKTKENIVRWRNALKDVAQIAGEHSRNWENDAAMIEKISTNVSNMLNMSTPSRDFDGFVGMGAHMEEMNQLLCLDLDDVRMIGIWGPPGIGKSTIARVLYNQLFSRFQLHAIMVNIKGSYPKPCKDEYVAQLELHTQMMSKIISQEDTRICHLGVARERLKDKKVLLVLDDVDQLGQLMALAKETNWFGPGSRIITTSEDVRVLKAHGISHIYKVKYPSSEEAFHIFCMYAFGKEYPDDGFDELAWEVTYLAGKLPLGLKILGSSLRRRSLQEWRMKMPTLRKCLDREIGSIIKLSYDALSDDDKDLFLYIACIFHFYYRTHQLEELLANKFSDVSQRLHVLHEKAFISIDEYGLIEMHTLLQQFGRETSRKQYVHAKRQLLIDARDICDDTIDCSKLIGIELNFSPGQTSEELNELNISEKAVESMSNLEFVHIFERDDRVAYRLHSVLYHSQKIRYLYWNCFQKRCLPSTFNTDYLVELEMCFSNLEKLWEGNKPLKSLKWMDLSYSTYLKELPDLSTATNLQTLNISNCSSLKNLVSDTR